MKDEPVLSRLKIQGVVGAKVRGGRLISCFSAPSHLTVPAGITELGSYCFSGQDNLVEVWLVNDVIKVGRACFANCPKLKRIVCNRVLRGYESYLRSGNNAVIVFRED